MTLIERRAGVELLCEFLTFKYAGTEAGDMVSNFCAGLRCAHGALDGIYRTMHKRLSNGMYEEFAGYEGCGAYDEGGVFQVKRKGAA